MTPEEYRDELAQGWRRDIGDGPFRDFRSFNAEETERLRPIAEVLAMLDGNAFFGTECTEGYPWWAQYLSEADVLFEANGGLNGWAGRCGWLNKDETA